MVDPNLQDQPFGPASAPAPKKLSPLATPPSSAPLLMALALCAGAGAAAWFYVRQPAEPAPAQRVEEPQRLPDPKPAEPADADAAPAPEPAPTAVQQAVAPPTAESLRRGLDLQERDLVEFSNRRAAAAADLTDAEAALVAAQVVANKQPEPSADMYFNDQAAEQRYEQLYRRQLRGLQLRDRQAFLERLLLNDHARVRECRPKFNDADLALATKGLQVQKIRDELGALQ